MNKNTDTFCFIPAKSTSQRLKLKNIKNLCGKPMMQYAIEAAQKSMLFQEDIYLSTDSTEIAGIAEKLGVKVPQLRPTKLANDPYGVKDVFADFLDRNPLLKTKKTVVIILPTAPLLAEEDICNAYLQFKQSPNKILMSVTASDHNAQRSIWVRNNELKPLFESCIRKKSQELETTYRINGAMIVLDLDHFISTQDFFKPPVSTYIMPAERSVDVDTAIDFYWAEFLIKQRDTE